MNTIIAVLSAPAVDVASRLDKILTHDPSRLSGVDYHAVLLTLRDQLKAKDSDNA